MEAVDGSERNRVNHNVMVADRLICWDLVLLAITNDRFFIGEKNGRYGRREGQERVERDERKLGKKRVNKDKRESERKREGK